MTPSMVRANGVDSRISKPGRGRWCYACMASPTPVPAQKPIRLGIGLPMKIATEIFD